MALSHLPAGHSQQLAFKVVPRLEAGFMFHTALKQLVDVSGAERKASDAPIFPLLERENAEKVLADDAVDTTGGETFVESALQLAFFWGTADAHGVAALLDVSPFGPSHAQPVRKTIVVTPGAPVAPPAMRFAVHFPSVAVHDFQANGICVVKGKVVIHNPFPRAVVATLQAHSPSTATLHAGTCYFFLGKTLQKLTLQPRASTEVPMSVGFSSHNSFTVDRFQLLIDDEVYFPEYPCRIQVQKANETGV